MQSVQIVTFVLKYLDQQVTNKQLRRRSTETVGGIAAIIACVTLSQIVDDYAVCSHLASWIDRILGDGATVVDAVYLRFRYSRRVALLLSSSVAVIFCGSSVKYGRTIT
jgi:quinol-cytochrome oxidoreductase complex cytochrome b subunit